MSHHHTDIAIFGDFCASGGVERVFANLIPAWDQAGLHVDVVGYRRAELFYKNEIADRARFVDLGTTGKAATAVALWRYIRSSRPKAIMATGHISNLILSWSALFPQPRDTKYLVSVHNDFVASGKDKTGRKRSRKLRQIGRWYPRTDELVVTSQGLRENLVGSTDIGNMPVRVIYNGVVTEELLARAREPAPHAWLAAERSTPVIIGAGRLKEQKDFFTLIRAFARLREHRAARLLIIGEGGDRPELERLVQELGIAGDVALPGFTNNPYAWIERADVFALSSLWEGFGNVVAEALALGTPVVSTTCPSGPAEILGQGEFGRLVPIRDPAALAEALAETLDEGNLCRDPSAASERFTAPYAAREYLTAFGLEPDGCSRTIDS